MKLYSKFVLVFTAFMLMTGVLSPDAFAQEGGVKLADDAGSAILIERDTGEIMFEKNSNEQLPPASMTKIMTMLLIMEAVDNGSITMDEKVRTSERAASMGGSQIFLEPGEEMTVEEMLKGIAIASGNDASVAMAEHLAGSEDEFVNMMNEKAKELGLKDTNFVNSNGLPAAEHYTTAHDMAMMSRELLKYEKITEYTSLYEDYLREDSDRKFWLVNTNRLVKFYPGVDGLKTGFTREAKYCLTATANKNDMRVIAVVMGASTPKDRNRQITEMLDYAFSQYKLHRQYDRGTVIDQVKVSKGSRSRVDAVTGENVSMLTRKGESLEGATEEVTWQENLKAPLKNGDPVGKLTIKLEGKTLSEVPLVITEDVPEASVWQLIKRTTSVLVGKERS
ncbi:D-alanyl-D-alanine carboxypeptidase family protein [Alteribacter natronophilus]|uniref:D-alanyl-D-alanine carboxypeptidase family protein n=1 Tax=Alteribacter natronophilus TaxID=2583810 RepID=UPI00110E95F6|nr:D-alanyl-D-alanine carboxypeptidase family protein [Alteribacter natronophilus]TMW73678.1 D-alanyl-D-alanine carboxypeptidase [Alteribacter natronophilus]